MDGWVDGCMHVYRAYTSRAWASRVTEASREGRTYKDKGEPIGMAPDRLAGTAVDCVISWKSLSLTFLNSRHLCLMLPLSLDLACSWHFCIFTDLSLACCLSGHLFLPDISSSHPCPMMPLSLDPACACHLWFLTASFLLTAQEPGTWLSSVPFSSRTDPSMPGATLCEKTQGFVRFPTPRHHLDAVVPLQSCTTSLLSTSLISPHALSISDPSTSLLSTSLISPHP